jgi:hypothetical protein
MGGRPDAGSAWAVVDRHLARGLSAPGWDEAGTTPRVTVSTGAAIAPLHPGYRATWSRSRSGLLELRHRARCHRRATSGALSRWVGTFSRISTLHDHWDTRERSRARTAKAFNDGKALGAGRPAPPRDLAQCPQATRTRIADKAAHPEARACDLVRRFATGAAQTPVR